MTTDDIRELVRAECAQASNPFGPSFFDEHVLQVAAFARKLAPSLGASSEVVELAAFLHDLSAVRDLRCVPTHHLDSAVVARGLLHQGGWPAATVDAVCRAIERHSAPVEVGRGSAEEVCLSNADVMAHLARPAYWFFYLYRVRGLGEQEALAWWRGRVERAWAALTPAAQAMIAPERATLLRVLGGPGEPSASRDEAGSRGRRSAG
jgi:hypothetical protein